MKVEAVAADQGRDAEAVDAARREAEQDEEEGQHQDRGRGDVAEGDGRLAAAFLRGLGGGLAVRDAQYDQGKRDQGTERAGEQQGRPKAPVGGDEGHHDRGHGAAEEAGEGVDREGATHARIRDAGGQDRIVGRVVDAVGEARDEGGGKQHRIARVEAEGHEGRAAEAQAAEQDAPGADPVDERAHRRLGDARDQAEQRDGEAEFDVADAEFGLEDGEKRRQDQNVNVAQPVRGRNADKRSGLSRAERRRCFAGLEGGRHRDCSKCRRDYRAMLGVVARRRIRDPIRRHGSTSFGSACRLR